MAVTITSTPAKISMARSPMIFALNAGSEATASGFQYRLEVRIWTGTISTVPSAANYILTKPPAPNGRTTFDISALVDEFITSNQALLNTTSLSVQAGEQFVAYQVKAGSVATINQVTSSTLFATSGYTSAFEGINASKVAAGVYSMQPPQIYMTKGVRAFLGGFYDIENPSFGSATINATTSTSITFSPANNATTQTGQKGVYFAIGTGNLTAASIAYGSKYTATINPATGEGAKTYTINVECSKHKAHTLYFINRFGMWDFICFYGNHTKGIESSAKQHMLTQVSNSSGTPTYDPSLGMYQTFNNMGRETYTLASGWHDERVEGLVQDLLMSKRVIMQVEGASLLIPVTVEMRTATYQRKPNVDVIAYEMQVKVAHELINVIR